MKKLLASMFVALLMAGCGEEEKGPVVVAEVGDGKGPVVVAEVEQVVDWVMENYSSIERGFAKTENDLRSSDVSISVILDGLADLVSEGRIRSQQKKGDLVILKDKLEDKKLHIEKVMKDAKPSLREAYEETILEIEGELDEKIKPLLDFDFQYLERFEAELNASMLAWKEFVEINEGLLDEGKTREKLATMISRHFQESMATPIEERRRKWDKDASMRDAAIEEEDLDDRSTTDKSETAFTIRDLSLNLLWVKPGTFEMGSPSSEKDRDDDETRHTVTLTQGFYLGKHEVTQSQWQKVMGSNPSKFNGGDRPVESVSWTEVTSFCNKLTASERTAGRLPAGMTYQLPTEAQWEYACRAGTKTAFSFGDGLVSRQANISGGPGETTDVGKYPANAWGFHDMHGNVFEWCADWHGDYPAGAARDPVGPADGSIRVFRGGSWLLTADYARSAIRRRLVPAYGDYSLGFRLSLRPASK
jgi:formylglycine-generating enzyme